MEKKMKKYMKDGMTLAATGVGLSVMSSLDSTGSVSKMSKAMPVVGGIYGAGMVMDTLNTLSKKNKKYK